jgi:hypothetical protein
MLYANDIHLRRQELNLQRGKYSHAGTMQFQVSPKRYPNAILTQEISLHESDSRNNQHQQLNEFKYLLSVRLTSAPYWCNNPRTRSTFSLLLLKPVDLANIRPIQPFRQSIQFDELCDWHGDMIQMETPALS